MSKFADKRVLITGAAGGIGSAIAKMFCIEGAHLALLDRDEQKLQEVQAELVTLAQGRQRIEVAVADLSTYEGVKGGIKAVLEPFLGVDIFIGNVGRLFTGAFEEMKSEVMQESMAINYYSHLYALWMILPLMKRQRAGRIILMGSDQALQPNAYQSAYGAAKAALHHTGKSLALELAPYGIKTSILAPGMVDTPLVQGVFAKRAAELGISLEQAKALEIAERGIPRLARVEEIAEATLCLAHIDYTNGSVWQISGGNVRSVVC
jgi:3-oxoacyl-[acyl-carrier protein] reductase